MVWHDWAVGTALAVLGVLAVVFVAALVATRDGGLLVDAPRDRADHDLPLGAPVTPDDLAAVRFGMALRGYRMAEVDALLDRLSGELRERDVRLAELEANGAEPAHGPDSGEAAEPEVQHLPDRRRSASPCAPTSRSPPRPPRTPPAGPGGGSRPLAPLRRDFVCFISGIDTQCPPRGSLLERDRRGSQRTLCV